MSRTNIGPRPENGYANATWRVTEPFHVLLRVGIAESNASYGSSRIYGNVWRSVELPAGTVVDATHGGTFVHFEGCWWEAEQEAAVKAKPGAFERRLDDRPSEWPLDRLEPADTKPEWEPPATRRDGQPRWSLAEIPKVAIAFPNRLDWVLT